MRFRGFSLLEGVMAIAVLFIGVSMVLPMFDVALRYTTRVEQETVATTIARSRLADLRAWASNPTNYANLNTFPRLSTPDLNYPDFAVQVTHATTTVASGCTSFENNFAGDPRLLTASCKRVQLRVSWTTGGLPSQITMVSLLGVPPLTLNSTPVQIIVTAGSLTSMDADEVASVRADVLDSSGNSIPDVMVDWSVVPGTGKGTITQNRSGSSAQFQSRAYLWTGMPTHTKGRCKIRASVRYHGIETWGYSPDIDLDTNL